MHVQSVAGKGVPGRCGIAWGFRTWSQGCRVTQQTCARLMFGATLMRMLRERHAI